MFKQDALYLSRVDIFTTRDNHILESITDVEISLLIQIAHITGVEPSKLINGTGRRIRSIPVTLHDVWALDTDFASLERRDRRVGAVYDTNIRVNRWQTC